MLKKKAAAKNSRDFLHFYGRHLMKKKVVYISSEITFLTRLSRDIPFQIIKCCVSFFDSQYLNIFSVRRTIFITYKKTLKNFIDSSHPSIRYRLVYCKIFHRTQKKTNPNSSPFPAAAVRYYVTVFPFFFRFSLLFPSADILNFFFPLLFVIFSPFV